MIGLLIFFLSEITTETWPNGNPKVICDFLYINGISIKHGSERHLSPEGMVTEEISWQLNRKDGAYKKWHCNSQLSVSGHFLAGRREGLRKTFYEDGLPCTETIYVNGSKDGEERKWWSNGKPKMVAIWQKGKLIRQNWFRPNGSESNLSVLPMNQEKTTTRPFPKPSFKDPFDFKSSYCPIKLFRIGVQVKVSGEGKVVDQLILFGTHNYKDLDLYVYDYFNSGKFVFANPSEAVASEFQISLTIPYH